MFHYWSISGIDRIWCDFGDRGASEIIPREISHSNFWKWYLMMIRRFVNDDFTHFMFRTQIYDVLTWYYAVISCENVWCPHMILAMLWPCVKIYDVPTWYYTSSSCADLWCPNMILCSVLVCRDEWYYTLPLCTNLLYDTPNDIIHCHRVQIYGIDPHVILFRTLGHKF